VAKGQEAITIRCGFWLILYCADIVFSTHAPGGDCFINNHNHCFTIYQIEEK